MLNGNFNAGGAGGGGGGGGSSSGSSSTSGAALLTVWTLRGFTVTAAGAAILAILVSNIGV
jgi:hypothetical protein